LHRLPARVPEREERRASEHRPDPARVRGAHLPGVLQGLRVHTVEPSAILRRKVQAAGEGRRAGADWAELSGREGGAGMSETKHRNRLPFAEDTNYWKTSQSSADSWMDKTIKLIRDFGGRVTAEAFGSEPVSGRSAFMLAFEMQGDQFKIIWPVLPSRARGGEMTEIKCGEWSYE